MKDLEKTVDEFCSIVHGNTIKIPENFKISGYDSDRGLIFFERKDRFTIDNLPKTYDEVHKAIKKGKCGEIDDENYTVMESPLGILLMMRNLYRRIEQSNDNWEYCALEGAFGHLFSFANKNVRDEFETNMLDDLNKLKEMFHLYK